MGANCGHCCAGCVTAGAGYPTPSYTQPVDGQAEQVINPNHAPHVPQLQPFHGEHVLTPVAARQKPNTGPPLEAIAACLEKIGEASPLLAVATQQIHVAEKAPGTLALAVAAAADTGDTWTATNSGGSPGDATGAATGSWATPDAGKEGLTSRAMRRLSMTITAGKEKLGRSRSRLGGAGAGTSSWSSASLGGGGFMRRKSHSKQGTIEEVANVPTAVSAPAILDFTPRATGNANSPRDYVWLEAALGKVVSNSGPSLGCKDDATGKEFNPIFFIAGGCPNMFCGMQAVMFAAGADLEVDFWWVKPVKGAESTLEQNTLHRHNKGPHKNDPGRSKPFYKPLADLFDKDAHSKDGVRFGIVKVDGAPRAFLERESEGPSGRVFLYLIWQEDWTTNPFARSKFIEGKIVYQKDPAAQQFFSRQYCITNGAMALSEFEDAPFTTVIPGEQIKFLRE